MRMLRVLSCLLLPVLSSCATYAPSDYCVMDTSSALPVMHADRLASQLITSQRVVIRSARGNFEFYAQLEIANNQLVLVAMSSLGNKLFQLTGSRGAADLHSWGVPLDFDASHMLADLGMIYAPADAIRQCLAQTGAPITLDLPDAQTRLLKGGDVDVRIEYSGQDSWPAAVHYYNHMLGYEIQVQTLSVDFL